jgi:hypothetical protein
VHRLAVDGRLAEVHEIAEGLMQPGQIAALDG